MQSDLETLVNEDMRKRGYDPEDITDSIAYWRVILDTNDISIETYREVYEHERGTLH